MRQPRIQFEFELALPLERERECELGPECQTNWRSEALAALGPGIRLACVRAGKSPGSERCSRRVEWPLTRRPLAQKRRRWGSITNC